MAVAPIGAIGLGILAFSAVCYLFKPEQPLFDYPTEGQSETYAALVKEITGIELPPGAKFVGFCRGVKDSNVCAATKIEIPSEQRAAFEADPAFARGQPSLTRYELGSRAPWWRRPRLSSRVTRIRFHPSGLYVECSVGEEEGRTVIYLSWANRNPPPSEWAE